MTPRIAVVGAGGSIGIRARHSLDLHEYGQFGERLEIGELLRLIPEAGAAHALVAVPFRTVGSPALAAADWLALDRLVADTVAGDPAIVGVVVTHGTDTLEETAYFLHLTAAVEVPVVMVAAQRPPNGLGSDAGINLVNAIRVAAAPAARGLGVLVVLNDQIHSAREVTKGANHRLDAFRAPDYGMLGEVGPDGSVSIYRRPGRRHAPGTEFDVRAKTDLPRVGIVYAHAGAGREAVDGLLAAGVPGIVNAALPSGRTPPAMRAALVEAVARGVLVVQSSRAGSGRVILRPDDRDAGFVGADTLNPQKARVLAMLALAATDDRREIERMFAEY